MSESYMPIAKWNKQSEKAISYMISNIWYYGKSKTMDTIKRWEATGEKGGREINWQSTDNL